MKKLVYVKPSDKTQNVELKIINTYEINRSSQEVTFSDLTCDFTNLTVNDLPEKYQEVKIMDTDTNKIKFFGYVDSYSFDEMRETDEFLEIKFVLLSPMKLATLRTFIAVGIYNLDNLIQNIILKPLINDGFEIDTIDISNKQVTVNFLSKTVEEGMNYLCNQNNLWWFIDENKKIFVKDLDKTFNEKPSKIYNNEYKISGLQYIKPTVSSYNYANVVNFSNVRVYEYSELQFNGQQKIISITPLIENQISGLSKGEELLFRFPVDLKKENILKSGNSYQSQMYYIGIKITGYYSDTTPFSFYVNRYENGSWTSSSNFGYKGDENATQEFLLIRDSFFSNLITGFEYNGSKTIASIERIETNSALAWEVFKFYNDKAINDKKGIINDTGIVEITVDMNETWKTIQELQDIGITFMNNNSLKYDGEIELKLDKNIFNVGDIVEINKMLFDGKYIVTNVKEIFTNNVFEYFVTCKNANIINDYIDLFRPSISEISDEKTYQITIGHYTEEGIKETFEVVQ